MTTTEPKWRNFLKDNKWTTYLAYELKPDSSDPVITLLKYEALLTQCSYLSRMAYCPADIFCRMTQHLDVTPNAFNNRNRAIEKIYYKLFNYKCSFDSKYIQEHPEFSKYFKPVVGEISALEENSRKVTSKQTPKNGLPNPYPPLSKKNNNQTGGFTNIPIGFFVQDKEHMNVYLYVHHNPDSKFNNKKTLFIAFKGSSSINDFIHDLKTAAKEDLFLSELNEGSNKSVEFEMIEMSGGKNDPLINPGEKYGTKTENNKKIKPEQSTRQSENNIRQLEQSTPQSENNNIRQPEQSTPQLQSKPSTTQSQNNNKKIKPGKGGWGFIHILKPSIQEICKKIELLKSHNFERVIITGHSLGGALASLFGYYLKKYNPTLVNVPIHVVTFGACCVFDAPGRNEFNAFLNISDPVFTLDRVTSNFDPVIVLPVDLDHPGYTLLRTELRAFSKTGRTNEIGEIRKMLGLEKGYDGNDLLLSERFVNLFTNAQDFKGTGKFDTDLYREKFIIIFGSNAKEQQLILEKAMPDAIPETIRKLFITIESDAGNKRYDDLDQKGGLHNPFSKDKRESQKLATEEYKRKTEEMMPNQIQYSCYKTMTMGFCHASYMGVSYIMVLRLPNIKGGYKAKKEPTKDYTLYKKNGRIFSSASGNYTNNSDCTKVESNVSKKKNILNKKSNKKSNRNTSSLMNRFTGFFKSKKNKKKHKNSNGNIELQPINQQNNKNNSTTENPEEEKQGIFSKCSIL
jgi:hypothetical protein